MIRENPKTGVLEESDMLGLTFSPVINDNMKSTRTNPETGVKEELGILGLSWNPVINDAGDMTRRDPATGDLQKSGPFNLWWEGASSDSGTGNHSNTVSPSHSSASSSSTPSSSSGDSNYFSGGRSSTSALTSTSTALNALKSSSGKIIKGAISPTSVSTSGSRLGTAAVIVGTVAAVVIVGSILEAMFTDKNIIKRLPPVTPPQCNPPLIILLLFASLAAVSTLIDGLGIIDSYSRFNYETVIGGGIVTTICLFGWIFFIRNEGKKEKEYRIAVKKREEENREIDRRNEAYRKKKAAGK